MRALVTYLSVCALLTTSALSADAKKRAPAKHHSAKKKKKEAPLPAEATKQTRAGVEALMGKYKWGMSPKQVTGMLVADATAELEPKVKAVQDPMLQDQERRDMMEELKKIRESYVAFDGKRTPWDVSLVDKEFAHKNNEAVVVSWGKREKRFFFFHHERLFKIFIAFNSELYQGKTFEDFSQVMENRFGKAERKYSPTLTGDAKLDHLAWPPSKGTRMLAYDYTKLYGNFCLALVDKAAFQQVREGRKVNSPRRDYADPFVDSVVQKDGDEGNNRDAHEDIVDQITGRNAGSVPKSDNTSSSPSRGGSKSGGSAGSSATPSHGKPTKKIDTKNPLDGLEL